VAKLYEVIALTLPWIVRRYRNGAGGKRGGTLENALAVAGHKCPALGKVARIAMRGGLYSEGTRGQRPPARLTLASRPRWSPVHFRFCLAQPTQASAGQPRCWYAPSQNNHSYWLDLINASNIFIWMPCDTVAAA
jgi:hypothetical protein